MRLFVTQSPMNSTGSPLHRSGFTWKELCCALAIIGLLLGLIAIPVQKARRAAMRAADQ